MPLRLGLFGDSLAVGTGAQRAGDALGPRLVDALRRAGIEAVHRVHAVSGARSAALPAQVAADGGWSQVAVVVVGANDLTHLVPVPDAVRDLRTALTALTPAAQVVLVPVPDLSVVAHVPPALRELVRAAAAALRTAQSEAARSLGARVVDTSAASALTAADPALFSADRFHPSSAGYGVLAGVVAPLVLDAARAVLGDG
ncbi:SGNH/GDSL hydrolase family protein [Kineococcus rhizosphaerae]|uniref:Lysophospholipase L1-like esterase n=1 Tax=Kineococcus rhizosphaerae TaxID=559628 RepID=A0A2T0R056_9ACTN|nr:SGNH/GDSL hydrolase family protein [Kineococcus rhizosphaerae]PRY12496.1 lysophospholipase L1-like esterase [Kineococcus rhizosphaerae]